MTTKKRPNRRPKPKPHNRPKRVSDTHAWSFPRSGVLIGALRKALCLTLPPEIERHARGYLNGRRGAAEEKRAELYLALGCALIDENYVSQVEAVNNTDRFEDELGLAIALAADWWDELVGQWRGLPASPAAIDGQIRSLVRVATVDVAVRTIALRGLVEQHSGDLPARIYYPDGIPEGDWRWGTEFGVRAVLESLMETPDRGALAKLVSRSRRTIDDWFAGKNPPDSASIEHLARRLAPRAKVSVPELSRRLRWSFAGTRLSARLASSIGWSEVEECARAFSRFIRVGYDMLRLADTPTLASVDALHSIFLLGVRAPHSRVVVDWLVQIEAARQPTSSWIQDLRAAQGSWLTRPFLVEANAEMEPVEGGERSALVREMMTAPLTTIQEMLANPRTHLQAATAIADTAFARGDVDSAAKIAVHIAEIAPGFETCMWAGVLLSGAEAFTEALKHLQSAAELSKKDPSALRLAQATIGVVLVNAKQHEKAVQHFEANVEWSPHFGVFYGIALIGAGRIDMAVEVFERVLSEVPQHGLALDRAAHCYFARGDRAKGRSYAERAKKQGVTDAYMAWKKAVAERKRRLH